MRERPKYNYHDLLSYLSRGRNKNDRPSDKGALRIIRSGGEPCVRMYSTTIARFHEDGTITINAGGWEDSNTTRANIGEVTGAWADSRVFQDGHWQFEHAPAELRTLHYVAGGHFYATGDAVDVPTTKA